ncbi:hypothetical protein B0H14DRAFT_3518029 [Mycena olivaceomarginata]|nr:hypothetical protein B0H14DRAFT_3518029 [Mycena olivaceomarginata]
MIVQPQIQQNAGNTPHDDTTSSYSHGDGNETFDINSRISINGIYKRVDIAARVDNHGTPREPRTEMPSTHAHREFAIHIAENVSIGSERESKAPHLQLAQIRTSTSTAPYTSPAYACIRPFSETRHVWVWRPQARRTPGQRPTQPEVRHAARSHHPSLLIGYATPTSARGTSTPVRAPTEKALHAL